jgi:hypothetical protein
VAFAAFYRLKRIAWMIPMTGRPIVVLVLQLHPSHPVDFGVNKLFVTRRAILRSLEEPTRKFVVLGWICANEKIAGQARQLIGFSLP